MLRRALSGGKRHLDRGSCKNITRARAECDCGRRPKRTKILIRIRMLHKARRESILLLFGRERHARVFARAPRDPRGACSEPDDSSANCVAWPRKNMRPAAAIGVGQKRSTSNNANARSCCALIKNTSEPHKILCRSRQVWSGERDSKRTAERHFANNQR
jgi:hypothetical protein